MFRAVEKASRSNREAEVARPDDRDRPEFTVLVVGVDIDTFTQLIHPSGILRGHHNMRFTNSSRAGDLPKRKSSRPLLLIGFGVSTVVFGLLNCSLDEQPVTSVKSSASVVDLPIYDFALSADESLAFCRSIHNRIDVCNTRTGETVAVLDYRGKHPIDLSVGGTGDSILVLHRDGTLVLWTAEAENGRYRPQVVVVDSTLNCCALSPDASAAAIGHQDGMVAIWDLRNNVRRHCVRAHSGNVTCVRFASDGLSLLSAYQSIRVFCVKTGRRLADLAGHTLDIRSAEFSPDGRQILSGGSYDGTIRLWDLSTANEVWRENAAPRGVFTVAWKCDGKSVASGNIFGELQLRDVSTGKRTFTIPVAANALTRIRFSAVGETIFTSSLQGGVIRLTIPEGREQSRDSNASGGTTQ